VRVSAFDRRDPGYIEQCAFGPKGRDELDLAGGHLVGLWKPSESISAKFSALLQDSKGYGSTNVTSAAAALQQTDMRVQALFTFAIQSYSATLTASWAPPIDLGHGVQSFSGNRKPGFLTGAWDSVQAVFNVGGMVVART